MIAIVNYGLSNTEIIVESLKELHLDYLITNKEYDIIKADKIILPGDGEIHNTIKQLHKNNLFTMLRVCKKPVLGINTGMQVFGDYLKGKNIGGLGLYPAAIEKFDSEISKVPFIGLNSIEIKVKSKLFHGIGSGSKFYFDHSYYLPINIYTTSVVDNKTSFSASVENGNYYGVQFNPEKSGEVGLQLLMNFIEL